MSRVPEFVVGRIVVTDYMDGRTSEDGAQGTEFVRRVGDKGDDLQSAGLTEDQFVNRAPPDVQNQNAPTAAEIRRLAIFNDYSGLIDTSRPGGFGVLAGPGRNGKVWGREYLAFARLPEGGPLFTVMAQIPEDFDRDQPMIITAPASGSRGIYGAISTAEWGFMHKCAVAYTDKGTAPGFHDLDSGAVYGVDGLRLPPHSAEDAVFKVAAGADLDAYKRALPHRLAVKHAHSQANIEASWGKYVLYSIRFSLFCLNDWLGAGSELFARPRVKVIAAGVSNGGGSALRAAEEDDLGAPLVDAVVVSEPQIQPAAVASPEKRFAIRYGGSVLASHSRSFLDTVTLMDVYAPCAAFAIDTSDPSGPLQQQRVQRCAALAAGGLLKGSNAGEQSREALALIHQHGFLPEADPLLPALDLLGVWPLLAAVYSSAHARAGLTDHLCGVSIAPVDHRGTAKPLPEKLAAQLCGWSNGLAYVVGPERTAVLDDQATTAWSLGSALCFRSLVTGVAYAEQNAVEARWVDAARMQQGIGEVRATGDLHGKPAIVLHGRSDPLLPPNHTSRAYFGLNKTVEGRASQLSYIEVVNGNHFDSFIPLFGSVFPLFGPNTLVPMHYYFERALSLMRAHILSDGRSELPPSQVVVGSTANKPWKTLPDAQKDLGDLDLHPSAGRSITFEAQVVSIPGG